jgi:nucleotide-binding universal stress UspA family protein
MVVHQRKGNTVQEIIKAADEFGSDLIVVATHGRYGLERFLFGSTCDALVRTSPVPVLAVKPSEREIVDDSEISISTIFCPMDFSEFSKSTLPHATALAEEFGAKIILGHVVDARLDYPGWTTLPVIDSTQRLVDAARANLKDPAGAFEGIRTEVQIGIGLAHQALVTMVDEHQIDLIVMPTHGRKSLAHALLGSVAEKVARMANCPVLTVRPTKNE